MMAAKSGVHQAQYNIGKMYRDGVGTDADSRAAARWFLAAANQGYAKAQNHIGVRLARGDGIQRNDVEALKWLILAEKSGHELASQNRRDLALKLTIKQRAEAKTLAAGFAPAK
jgi:TPR repeat protein